MRDVGVGEVGVVCKFSWLFLACKIGLRGLVLGFLARDCLHNWHNVLSKLERTYNLLDVLNVAFRLQDFSLDHLFWYTFPVIKATYM